MTLPLPSGFVTFLFTDIEGSTRLFRSLGDEYVPLLERHHELLREAWTSHNGVEVKTEGDAFFVAFFRPDDALAAAVAAQSAIMSERWNSDPPLRIRIGIHSGLAAPRNDDYIAFAVHQAARVVGAAHGGQILVSEVTREALTEDFRLQALGRFRLRDFDEPVPVYLAGIPGQPADTRMPRATPAMGHNLTRPAATFVGRSLELEELTGLVEPGTVVSVVGPGGAGKTRLATEFGLRAAVDWADGVWLVGLTAAQAGMPVAGLVAEALGISVASRDPLDAVIEDLEGKSAVVILDNCEHVVAAAANLADQLLEHVPSVAVLATSREPLNVGGERTFRLTAMAPETGAVDLFIDRARTGGMRLEISPAERTRIGRICSRLDGNALAIELAAARVGTVGLDALETALDDRFRFLRSRRRDLEPRQQSMTALLDWSHDLLSADEQIVFRRIAAFKDGFSLKGAEAATVGEDLSPGAAVDAVWALVDKSLLAIDDSEGETRYVMSETVRSYAYELLKVSADQLGTWRQLGFWYLAEFGPWTHFGIEKLSELKVELDNIRGVIDALATDEPETAQGLAVSVGYVRDLSGEIVEGMVEMDGLTRRLTARTPMRAILLAATCRLHYRAGEHDFGSLLDEAEALLSTVGPEPEWAAGAVASMRALWLNSQGDAAAALEVATAIAAGDAPLVALARSHSVLGILKGDAGDAAGALKAHRLGLAVEEQLGGPIEIAIGHNNVAEYALQLGRIEEASTHQSQALEIAAQIGSMVLVAFSLVIAARVAAAADEWDEAVRLHGSAERWLAESGSALYGRDADLSDALLTMAQAKLGNTFPAIHRAGTELALDEAIAAAGRVLHEASGRGRSDPTTR